MNGIKVQDLTAHTCTSVFNNRPHGVADIKAALLHTTEGENSYEWLRCGNEVSIHKLIAHDGTIIKMVDEKYRAWHAGVGEWGGYSDWNTISIGYELEHKHGFAPAISDAQYEAIAQTLAYDCARFHIEDYWVRHHRDIAPTRRTDPTDFDDARMWRRIAEIRADWPKEWAPLPCWFKANR